MHIITLSCDDGFRASSIRTAEIYEKYGLAACFNIIATGHAPDFETPDSGQAGVAEGDFALWNELQARGHEVMPHSYKHANLAELPFGTACDLILRCLDVFDAELDGFDRARAVYNFAYNRATPELEAWVPTQVRATRCGGVTHALNPLPTAATQIIRTGAFGPGNGEHYLDACIDALLAQPSGWLCYNTHGLDDEGWGPIGADYLDRLLDRLVAIDTVRILPAGPALDLGISTGATP
jgi:peptidoglycan/xylan/chitin deacetylase (PgdA/CDA1 family)